MLPSSGWFRQKDLGGGRLERRRRRRRASAFRRHQMSLLQGFAEESGLPEHRQGALASFQASPS